MVISKLTQKFIDNPNNLEMGAGKLASRWKTTVDEIKKSKAEARRILNLAKAAEAHVKGPKYVGSDASNDGVTKKFESPKPLSPAEIKQLAQVDDITSFVSRVWEKQQTSGLWTYSIDVRFAIKDFYNAAELKSKLKELLPNVKPVKAIVPNTFNQTCLVVAIADEHVGALNGESMYGKSYTPATYTSRLGSVLAHILASAEDSPFEEIHILSLGDQLNGWNEETTRGGHRVKSMSNKEQFDIYVEGRRMFYDSLFASGSAAKYYIHDVENSNHSGKGFSYMANRCLEMYLEAKYPEVVRTSHFAIVDSFDYGVHTIGFGHGKDEDTMFKPMPLKLDPKTDLYLFEWFDHHGLSPRQRRITFYKGDLHSYSVDKGKFGRYINVPAFIGATDFGEANFGNNEAGAILEIFDKTSSLTNQSVIWF